MPSAGASWSDLIVTVTDEPSQSALLAIVPPSDSIWLAMSVAERAAVPLVISPAVRLASPARPTGSSAPPLSLPTVAVPSGRSFFATVTTPHPLARVTSNGLGPGTATGVPGGGGLTRAAAGA